MFKKCHDHLETVHESYLQHMGFAFSVGLKLIGGGIAAILHGLCPAVFQQTGSQTILSLADHIKSRQAASAPQGNISHDA